MAKSKVRMAEPGALGPGNLSSKDAPGLLWVTPSRMSELIWWCFGRWLAARRKEVKLSVTAAARQCGISPAEWRWIEKGVSKTPIERVLLVTLSVGADTKEACLRYRISGRERKAALSLIANGQYSGLLNASNLASKQQTA